MIQVKNLGKAFGRNTVLRNVDLQVEDGEFVTIFGPNGAGKSTLLHILAGIMKPSEGRIRINGTDVAKDPVTTRRAIGLVSHLSFLYHDLTATENLTFYGQMYDVPELSRRIGDLLQRVGLALRAHDPVRIFSRGMIQRLALARALLHSPPVLLLDEPFTGLDQKAETMLSEILSERVHNHSSVIMATHDLERGMNLCHRACILATGCMVREMGRHDMDIDTLRTEYDHLCGGGDQ